MERWRWEATLVAPEYVLINIPAYELQVMAHGSTPPSRGGGHASTPDADAEQPSHFTLAPDGHVPNSIANKEMLPHLRKATSYLARNNCVLYDDRGRLLDANGTNWAAVTAQRFPYTIRQSAGCENALGNMVFRFANPYSVFLPDIYHRDKALRRALFGSVALWQR